MYIFYKRSKLSKNIYSGNTAITKKYSLFKLYHSLHQKLLRLGQWRSQHRWYQGRIWMVNFFSHQCLYSWSYYRVLTLLQRFVKVTTKDFHLFQCQPLYSKNEHEDTVSLYFLKIPLFCYDFNKFFLNLLTLFTRRGPNCASGLVHGSICFCFKEITFGFFHNVKVGFIF